MKNVHTGWQLWELSPEGHLVPRQEAPHYGPHKPVPFTYTSREEALDAVREFEGPVFLFEVVYRSMDDAVA